MGLLPATVERAASDGKKEAREAKITELVFPCYLHAFSRQSRFHRPEMLRHPAP
jgi:hypothetical protein